MCEAGAVESVADGLDHAVHHAGGGDHVGPGSGVAEGLLAKSDSVASLSTSSRPPASLRGPQWPWSVYSQKQRSVMMSRFGPGTW